MSKVAVHPEEESLHQNQLGLMIRVKLLRTIEFQFLMYLAEIDSTIAMSENG